MSTWAKKKDKVIVDVIPQNKNNNKNNNEILLGTKEVQKKHESGNLLLAPNNRNEAAYGHGYHFECMAKQITDSVNKCVLYCMVKKTAKLP